MSQKEGPIDDEDWSRLRKQAVGSLEVSEQVNNTQVREAWCAGDRRPCRRVLRWLLLLLIVLAPHSGPAVFGADAVAGATLWTRFTQQQDGLVTNDVRTVLAYGDGVWFGGNGGASHYDGTWTAYAELGTQSARELLTALAGEDGAGVVWGGTASGLIVRWGGESWSEVVDLRAAVHALALVDGELWAGTSEGLYRIQGTEPELVDAVGRQPVFAILSDGGTVWLGARGGLWRYRDSRWGQLAVGEAGMADGVLALARLAHGGLVAGVHTGLGIQAREGGPWSWYTVVDEAGDVAPVQALALGLDGVIWAGTNGAGLLRLDMEGDTYQTFGYTGDTQLTTPFVRDVGVDRDGSVWFATPAGIFRFQPERWSTSLLGAPEDERNYINALLTAADGSLWVGTGGAGLRRLESVQGPEQQFTQDDGALDVVYALAEDASGAIWAGGEDGLRRYYDDLWHQPITSDALPSTTISSLLAEVDFLWIGTPAGLARFDFATDEIEVDAGTAGLVVDAIARDGRGNLWIGTHSDGIWRQNAEGRWRQFLPNPLSDVGLVGVRVTPNGLAPDSANPDGMWAAMSSDGLAHWDGERWRMMSSAEGAPSNLIWALHTDPIDGALWIGSETGVTRYDGISFATLTLQDGLQSAVILAIARSQDGGYWFGGRAGLSHFQPELIAPWIRITGVLGLQTSGLPVMPRVAVGERVLVDYSAGDLQSGTDVAVFARVIGPGIRGSWTRVTDAYWSGTFDLPGVYQLELMAQDRSFNYSPVAAMTIAVVRPTAMVWVPLLGEVESGVFRTLVLLGTVVVFGVAYMATTVLRQRRRSKSALLRAYNPYISGEPVRRDDMFFGRRELLQRIIDTLHNNSIMIYGERRIGKTTLLFQMVVALREVDDPEYWFVPVFVDLEGTPQGTFFHYLAEEIITEVEGLRDADVEIVPYLENLRYYVRKEHVYSDRDFSRDLNLVMEVLAAYATSYQPDKHLRLILLIDEMDVMTSYDRIVQQQLRRIFMREFAETLGAVVAGIQISRDWDRVESPWFNMFNEIALTPFTREQALELLVEPVRGIYQYDAAAIEFILDNANGRPYRIQQYGLEAVNHMLAHRRRRITLADAEAAHERIESIERDATIDGQAPKMLQMLRRALTSRGEDDSNGNAEVQQTAHNGRQTQSDERPLS